MIIKKAVLEIFCEARIKAGWINYGTNNIDVKESGFIHSMINRPFPHLHKEEFIFRLWGVVENCPICPIVFNVYEQLKDELWYFGDGRFADDQKHRGQVFILDIYRPI